MITSCIITNAEHIPKVVNTNRESIKGSPKDSNVYGDGAPIVGDIKRGIISMKRWQRSFSTSTDAANDHISGAELLSKLKVRNGKYYGMYKLICDEEILFGSYYMMRSKPGNMSPGTDEETFDGISKEWISKLSEELKTEIFKFRPVRREWIPKANGKLRPLGIPSPRDKIVQKAIAIVLGLIYEPCFSEFSHGFRPERSCQTAIRQIAN